MISLFFHISTVVKIVKYEPLTEQTFPSRDVWQIPYTHNTVHEVGARTWITKYVHTRAESRAVECALNSGKVDRCIL